MQKKLYAGKVTMDIFTVVDDCDDAREERNKAHEAFDFDLMKELRTLIEMRGYHVPKVGVDLQHVEEANKGDINFVDQSIEESKNKKNTRVIRIQL